MYSSIFNIKKFKSIILDLDDTLYPESEFVYSGYKIVSDWLQINYDIDVLPELKSLFDSGFRGDVFTPVLKKYLTDFTEDFVKFLVQIYREHIPIINLHDDAYAFLEQNMGKTKLVLLTDGYINVQTNKVKALGIESYFDFILYSDKYGRVNWKPNMMLYKECLDFLELNSGEVMCVGDNPYKDFIGAKKLGIYTVRIKRELGEHSNVILADNYEADAIIKSFTDFASY